MSRTEAPAARPTPRTLGYRAVWLIAMFDLPVKSRPERRASAQFRKRLLRLGFSRIQFSVYARYYRSEEASDAHRRDVRLAMPPRGQVRLVGLTDKQFSKMEVFLGRIREAPEGAPPQLALF